MSKAEQLKTIFDELGLDIGYYRHGKSTQIIIRHVNKGIYDNSVLLDFTDNGNKLERVWIDD